VIQSLQISLQNRRSGFREKAAFYILLKLRRSAETLHRTRTFAEVSFSIDEVLDAAPGVLAARQRRAE